MTPQRDETREAAVRVLAAAFEFPNYEPAPGESTTEWLLRYLDANPEAAAKVALYLTGEVTDYERGVLDATPALASTTPTAPPAAQADTSGLREVASIAGRLEAAAQGHETFPSATVLAGWAAALRAALATTSEATDG